MGGGGQTGTKVPSLRYQTEPFPGVEVDAENPVVDSVQVYGVGSSGEDGFAGVCEGHLALLNVEDLSRQGHERVGQRGACEVVKSGEQDAIADEVGVEILSQDFAYDSGSPGAFLFSPQQKLIFPAAEAGLEVGVAQEMLFQAGSAIRQEERFLRHDGK